MREIQRIAQLFADLQQGECWIGLNMQQALAGLDARMAANKHIETRNSIWQLVNHLLSWRKTVTGRITGIKAVHTMPDMYQPEDQTEGAWQTALQQFDEVYRNLHKAILSFDESRLETLSPKNEQTYYQLMMGCLQHDSYHMGQIVVIKKDPIRI